MVYFSSNDYNIKWMKERWKLLEDMVSGIFILCMCDNNGVWFITGYDRGCV